MCLEVYMRKIDTWNLDLSIIFAVCFSQQDFKRCFVLQVFWDILTGISIKIQFLKLILSVLFKYQKNILFELLKLNSFNEVIFNISLFSKNKLY